MTLTITPSQKSCGAAVTGCDLSQPLTPEQVADIRAAWLAHHVLIFPDQTLSPDDLLRVSSAFGETGPEPFVRALEHAPGIVPVQRLASETGPLFAGTWHSDWSFLPAPPIGSFLYAITIPPSGGDTLFANQHAALDEMPDSLRKKLDGKRAVHSARHAYGTHGTYAQMSGDNRGMIIDTGQTAHTETVHPLIRTHTETGRPALYGAPGHITHLADEPAETSKALLGELFRWQTRPDFQFRLKWQEKMLVLWDNRSLIHMATGGYQGHHRLLHRTMIWPQQ